MISSTVLASLPTDRHQSTDVFVSSSEGKSVESSRTTLKVRNIVRNFFLSPIRIALEIHGSSFLTASSIGTGAMFSAPAVIKSSLIRPVYCPRLILNQSSQYNLSRYGVYTTSYVLKSLDQSGKGINTIPGKIVLAALIIEIRGKANFR